MAGRDDFELHLVDLAASSRSADWREIRAREREGTRRRYVDYLTAELVGVDTTNLGAVAARAIDALTTWRHLGTGGRCRCSCHPRLPDGDLHDHGFGCPCTQTADEIRRRRTEWAALEAFRTSTETLAFESERGADESALDAWLAAQTGVVVTRHGGVRPEQWTGSVDGRTFYFRERHEQWRIELDLRPTGHQSKVWIGGDLGDESSFELRDIEAGDIIAEGTIGEAGYGVTRLDRIRFIADTIRRHLRRETCSTHALPALGELRLLLGEELRWCPACGTRLDEPID